MNNNLPLVVAITGATGCIYAIKLLEILRELKQKTILVVSEMGFWTIKDELGIPPKEIMKMADHYYHNSNLAAPIASGSFQTKGMVVAPCSVKSLSSIANCYDNNLISRAADVTLKERRKLIIMFRETPLHMGYINLMKLATESGAIIMPPVPAFYSKPQTIDDITTHTVGRCLDLLEIQNNITPRWKDN